jgi:hypothetical protein
MPTDTTTSASPAAAAIPLACVPGAIPAPDRAAHFALATRLLTIDVRERLVLADGVDGYAYRFDAGAFDDLARWITNERRCCPFLTFALALSPDAGPVWLRLSGPAGTREFLDAELPVPSPAAQ